MSLALMDKSLPAASPEILEKIALIEAKFRPREHTFEVQMEHAFHAGMYARTCRVPAKMAFSSVLIKIPTLLIVHGHCIVLAGNKWRELKGYNVIEAVGGRKQIYVTFGPTEITMLFPTKATTIEQAESEFTDEAENLLSRRAECRV